MADRVTLDRATVEQIKARAERAYGTRRRPSSPTDVAALAEDWLRKEESLIEYQDFAVWRIERENKLRAAEAALKQATDALEKAEDALRDIIDIHEGWTREMDYGERGDLTKQIARAALASVRQERQP